MSTEPSAPAPFGNGTLQISRRGSQRNIVLVALSRPNVRNAINDQVYEDLIGILQQSKRDASVAAVVLTGSGDFFSSGADLKGGHFAPEPGGRRTRHKPSGRCLLEILSFPKLLAAAVNGPAVGIAVTLLMHCDLVHCTPQATFWAPFARLALVPELCSSVTFLHTMGLSKANELLLLSRKIDAATALDWGICSQIVKDCDRSGDPFASHSLADHLCHALDRELLSLPQGTRTAQYFVSLVKGRRTRYLTEICRSELEQLDERFDGGEVAQAAQSLRIGSAARQGQQSKL